MTVEREIDGHMNISPKTKRRNNNKILMKTRQHTCMGDFSVAFCFYPPPPELFHSSLSALVFDVVVFFASCPLSPGVLWHWSVVSPVFTSTLVLSLGTQ